MDLKALFTAVVGFIQAAEAAYPQGGKGKDKFDLVAAQVAAFAPLAGISLDFVTALMPAIQAFATRVVGFFNATGVFRTNTADTAPKPAA
jgi:hypothetical protein